MSKIQNKKPEVETMVDYVKNQVVSDATQEIFNALIGLENIENLSDNISTEIVADLMHASFMTEQLELTEQQKERLAPLMHGLVERSKNTYLAKIKKDERTKDVAIIVFQKLTEIVEQLLSSIALEVNRGALINCVAVAADTKSEKYNKIELNALEEESLPKFINEAQAKILQIRKIKKGGK